MMKFKDYFKNLVSAILGGIPKQDKDVTLALDKINSKLTKTSYGNMFEMIVNMKNREAQSKDPKNADKSILDLVDVGGDYDDQIYDLFMRRRRYSAYQAVIKKISRLGRAIKVLRSNIISSDSIKNSGLVFSSVTDRDVEKEIKEAKDTFKFLKIDTHKRLSKIIDLTLKYGDMYAEIIPTKNFIKTKNERMHMESSEIDKTETVIETDIEHNNGTLKFNVSLIMDGFTNSILESEDTDTITLDDLLVIYHKPGNIIKLTLGDVVYGYLIVPENLIKTRLIFQGMNLYDTADKIQDITNRLGMDYVYAQKVIQRSIDITKNIINFLKSKINEKAVEDNDDLKSVITKLVFSSVYSAGSVEEFSSIMNNIDSINIGNIQFRFVDVSKMQEFSIDVDQYEPYGTSIFDDVLFDAKLLASDKITSSIDRITKSIERRIINFEVDNRNSAALIQILKEKFRKKKALFDGSGSIDNIPGMISPFEDYYIPMHNGTPFVNFSTEAPTTQHQAASDDMKFKRDEIVSNLDIPPAYLGLEENIESKATLFLQNILFAVVIMDYQYTFSDCFTGLLNKINAILGKDVNLVKVGFALPIILSSASEIEHISNVSGVADFLKGLGLDGKQILSRYMPFLEEYFTSEAKTIAILDKLEHGEEGKEGEEQPGGGF